MTNAKYNTFWERLFACMIDGALILLPIAYLNSYFLNPRGNMWISLSWIIFSHSAFLLYAIISHWKTGQTIGKRIFRIKVIDASSEDKGLSLKQAIMRDGIYFFLSILGIGMMVTNVYEFGRYSVLAVEPYTTYLQYLLYLWFLLELGTLFQNKKKRSLQDFVANSVVVKLR